MTLYKQRSCKKLHFRHITLCFLIGLFGFGQYNDIMAEQKPELGTSTENSIDSEIESVLADEKRNLFIYSAFATNSAFSTSMEYLIPHYTFHRTYNNNLDLPEMMNFSYASREMKAEGNGGGMSVLFLTDKLSLYSLSLSEKYSNSYSSWDTLYIKNNTKIDMNLSVHSVSYGFNLAKYADLSLGADFTNSNIISRTADFTQYFWFNEEFITYPEFRYERNSSILTPSAGIKIKFNKGDFYIKPFIGYDYSIEQMHIKTTPGFISSGKKYISDPMESLNNFNSEKSLQDLVYPLIYKENKNGWSSAVPGIEIFYNIYGFVYLFANIKYDAAAGAARVSGSVSMPVWNVVSLNLSVYHSHSGSGNFSGVQFGPSVVFSY